MNTQRTRRLAVGSAVLVSLQMSAGGAAYASRQLLTATCDNGEAITVEVSDGQGGFPSGLRLVDSTSTFTVHSITATSHETGESFEIKSSAGVARNKDLVSCTRVGTNYDFTWTGFFTPAS